MTSDNQYTVLKFGGSSLAGPERLLRVLQIIAQQYERGPTAVVLSAMGDTTDQLVACSLLAAQGQLEQAEKEVDAIADRTTALGLVTLQKTAEQGRSCGTLEVTPLVRESLVPLRKILYGVALLRERTAQTLDLIMAFGERLSATLVAELLRCTGVDCLFADARDFVVTDDTFGAALVDTQTTTTRLQQAAAGWDGKVVVTTGFTGTTPDGRTTTLGRNGSDYTASLLASGLAASQVHVFTDVPGVMTADPAIVSDAYPIHRMSYMEALELANFGAAMFHPRTMIPLIEAGIPMHIRSTLRPEELGTIIDHSGDDDVSKPTSVASLENLALISMQWRSLTRPAQMGQRVLAALARAGITVWMENQAAHGQSSAAVVPQGQVQLATQAIEEELQLQLQRGEVEPVSVRSPVTLLTLVGEAMGQAPGVAGRFFSALGAVGVNIYASGQGASSRSIACAIEAADTALAVRTVHAAFNFSHQKVSLLLLGHGTVGRCLLQQIRDQHPTLLKEHDVDLRVTGLADSSRFLFEDNGVDLPRWEEQLANAADATPEVEAMLDQTARLPVPILVDCTAADGMEHIYLQAFQRGVHVVAANKKPLTVPWPERDRLMAGARANHRAYRYETTVGASLPVIETIKDLVRTGDKVRLVEGSFSGTLGFLTNQLMAGTALSEAVRNARDLGYTEPNPQDDLSGLDAARKALILARELGYPVEMQDMLVEPLVPAKLLAPMELDEFFEALQAHDSSMEERLARARADNLVLRYLARIDPGANGCCKITVGSTWIQSSHPATRLQGTEAFVAFTTERYADHPLIVQGSGAGGAVTAAGVLADILRTAQTLRGR